MKKGYILLLSLQVLLIASLALSIKFNQVKMLKDVTDLNKLLKKRLESEKTLFDEINHKFFIKEQSDFERNINGYIFKVVFENEQSNVFVSGNEEYTIKLTYNDDCICFLEILYN